MTDWQLYDSVYTERYMDTPAENPEGYKQGAVLTYADRYKGGLRLTHGTIDDNVHMQNTLQVVDWLTTHNKRFELMVYPDSRHGIQPASARTQPRDARLLGAHAARRQAAGSAAADDEGRQEGGNAGGVTARLSAGAQGAGAQDVPAAPSSPFTTRL